MSTRHIAAEDARLHDLTPKGSSGAASKRFRQKLAADGFTVDKGFKLKPGYVYTVVRAISARVNQNYDGWPSEELKKSYKTFIGKPCFVNHENHDPTKARGVVVAARYVENGMDKYIEVVQEIDAKRFPKLAHEIKTGGLDSVSMGAEAGFTICSYCHNKATDLHDMCDHVRNHKGKTLTRFDKRTGKKEDVLVFESCHKISFFELSYVFEPADETAVASKVVVAGLHKDASEDEADNRQCEHQGHDEWHDYCRGCNRAKHAAAKPDWELKSINRSKATDRNGKSHTISWDTGGRGYSHGERSSNIKINCDCGWKADVGSEAHGRREFTDHIKSIKQSSIHTAAGDVAVPAPPSTPKIDQSVIDSTPVVNLSPATELTGHEAPGVPKTSAYDDDIAEITKLAGDCPPGMDCSRNNPFGLEQIGKDTPNNPVNQAGGAGGGVSGGGGGKGGSSPSSLDLTKWKSPDEYAKAMSGKPYNYGGAAGDPNGVDCSGYMSDIYSLYSGKPTRFTTDSDFAALGFKPGYKPGAFNIGTNGGVGENGHMAGTLPDGTAVESNGSAGVQYGGNAAGADNSQFSQQWHYEVNNTPTPGVQSGAAPAQRAAGKYTKEDFAAAGGKKPWETEDSDAEDAAAIEIEAMLLTAADDDEHEYRACGARNDPGPKMRGGGGARVYDSSNCQRKVKVSKGDVLTRCWQHDKSRRAGVFTAGPSDDYWEWKAEHGAEAEAEGTHGIGAYFPSWEQKRWLRRQDILQRKLDFMASSKNLTNPEYSQDTTRRNTIPTYLAAHDFLNRQGAPKGHSLDYGSGWGDTAVHPDLNAPRARFHTLEPHPNPGVEPDFRSPDDIDDGTYKRIHNLNVLNVAERGPRDRIVKQIGRILAPGGHAIITTRGRQEIESMLGSGQHAPGPESDPGSVLVNGGVDPAAKPDVRVRYQKGFTPDELHQYVSSVLGDGYTVTRAKGVGSAPAAVHIIRNADNVPAVPPRPIAEQARAARRRRSAAMKKTARQRALKLAFGEKEAPMAVDTLREEGSAPEDDNDDMHQYVDPAEDDFEQQISSPEELRTPDLSEAAQIDREQELAGASDDQMGGAPGPAEGGGAPQQQFMTLQIPIPAGAPQVPMNAAPPQMPAPAPQPGAGQVPPPPGQPITASMLDYFDNYYGRRVANWLDAIEAGRDMNPAEAADYRRQTGKLSTLENGRELSTTDRNPRKGTATMARTSIANRNKVATAGRRQHFAEGPLVDGGDRSRNDQGEQEEAFISQTPPPVAADVITDDSQNISNTEHNLVARVQKGRDQLLRDAAALASLRQRQALTEAGGPKPTVVDPTVNSGPGAEAETGDHFVSADPNDGVVPTNPKDASLRAFAAFDSWLAQKTGKSSRRHTEANIKKAAAAFSREAGISPQALFPALGIVLREARKNDKQANTKGAKMRKRSNDSLEVAAPDGRVDVEAPVSDTTDAKAQASQFDLHDFGNNAGDNVAKPDLSTDQNWAPGEASGKKASIKTAGGLLAMRCAEGMIAAGLEPNSRERKYQLAAEFESMNRGLIQDRVALLERFAAVRQADLRKVASGSSRGAARSPIPAGLGSGSRTAAAPQRTAAHDPSNDSTLFI